MRTTHILALCLWMCLFFGHSLNAQITSCGPEVAVDTGSYAGTGFFNFGSTARIKSNTYKSAGALGQTFIGYTENVNKNSTLGFYARYFLPPFALKVKATQGDLLDRIQVTWEVDQLGPSASEGFNVFRDGIKIYETSDPSTRNFNDFNVIAGRAYTYCVQGRNIFGEGVCSEAIGFQVPNGVVTGWISTINGTPVPDAEVILTPMQGFSAKFDQGDGAFAMQDTTTTPFLPALNHDWTIAFWIKTDTSINGRIIGMDSLYIRARTTMNGGIAISKTAGGTAYLVADYPAGTKHAWHHVALTYDGNGNKHRLYFDGNLVDIATSNPVPPPDTINFGALANVGNGTQTWKGRLDEVRIYDRTLDELDFGMVMDGTASSETPNLTHYWKMDEELGVKSYDIVKRHKLYFCGAVFDPDRPPVHTAGITNEDGYYTIESASYGTGITFLAKPKKNFYLHRALKFERADNDIATLPDFSMTKKATIEMWVNSAGPDGIQTLLYKKWGNKSFRLFLNPVGTDNEIKISMNGGTASTYGLLGAGYHLLAFTWDSMTGNIKGYRDSLSLTTVPPFTNVTGNWSDPAFPWLLGANINGTSNVNFYGGLIDEIAIYDTTLTLAEIKIHARNTRDIQQKGLRVYFPLDEGSGNKINNAGSVLLNGGTTTGTEWSPLAAHQVITSHEFKPSTRQVTLNPSVTSVDKVDFIDNSTIGVTGYVRYKNSDCFAKNVEILVNGLSFTPKVITDSTGRFVIDFDPGTSAILTPKFEDHLFTPAFWEITNLSSPIAGILFNDNTTRKITGQIAGGECRRSIINNNSGCILKVSSANGCLEQYYPINNADGTFTINNLPPLDKMQVVVVAHNDPPIYTAFQNAGGAVVDLTKKDTTGVDFIYFAPPEVQILSGLDPYSPLCPKIVLDQDEHVTLKIKLREHYYDGYCEIDTADFHIINGFGDEVKDTTMGGGLLTYKFIAGNPNPNEPYEKTLQIIGKTIKGVEGSLTKQAIVKGIKSHNNTFTTLLPEIPSLILRDPPGDGSYSYLEKNETFCKTTELIDDLDIGFGSGLTINLGADEEIILAPLGFGVAEDASSTFDIGAEGSLTYRRLSSNSFETCSTIDSRVATSDEDLIVGGERGGDVYMGNAINIVYGLADKVDFNPATCLGEVTTVFNLQPGDFATTFIYSEFYILGTLIPSLEALASDPLALPADVARYNQSINLWNTVVASNKAQKERARFVKNISFESGAEYEYSETSDTMSEASMTNLADYEFKLETTIGFDFAGFGFEGNLNFTTATSNGARDASNAAKGITTGYVLKDDDPLDAFTFDVGMDSMYRTPTFKLKAGQSSCPWEPGTANREGTNIALAPGQNYEALDVPANEAASFKLLLGNTSATHEVWTYSFTSIAENNPDGAVIKLNGQPLNYLQDYIINIDHPQEVTITVERGPVEYTYDNLLVAEVSRCEYERHLALSIPYDDDPNFFSGINLSVHFIRPCSEVKITVPAQQEWVIYPNNPLTTNDDELTIVASGYDLTEPSFSRIQLQYRPTGGDGAWLPIGTRYNPNNEHIPNGAALLNPVYTSFTWNTATYADGPYEIRALAVCENTIPNNNGYSEILKGRIDRQPPSLVGAPQPSDGVLNAGDEISFTFNQTINCQDILAAVIDHVNLYNTRTDSLIGTNVTCGDNKIVIDPLIQNKYIENEMLRADLDGIEDMTGNRLNHTQWEFYVDRNELAWLTDSAGITKYEDEEKSITLKIHNRGGYPVAFTIDHEPEGVQVSPNAGTLVANEIRDIQITASDSLDRGWIKDSLLLHTDPGAFMSGDEVLPFGVRTICRPPDWDVDPTLYQMSMTMVARIQFDTAPPYNDYHFSIDPEDQVAAFINGELRGTAKLVKSAPNNFFLAFVTIYGNTSDIGDSLTFELFNASECKHYPAVLTPFSTINFAADVTQGSPGGPKVLQNYGPLLSDLPLNKGWNWISFNLGFPDSTINQALHNIPDAAGDLIKDQTHFTVYNSGTWTGSLTTMTNTSAYLYQAAKPNNIKIIGYPLMPASVHIPIVKGMNWIGYIPTYSLPVTTALATLHPKGGDIIKSQDAFAQYVGGNTKSWVGNLKTLEPLHGYLLKIDTAGTLTYPLPLPFISDEHIKSRSPESLTSFWNVDASQYEFNMTLIGMFQFDEMNATSSGMELGAFVGDELRGVGEAVYVEYLDEYVFFMTCMANKSGEQLHFKLYDSSNGEIQDLHEKMAFAPNDNEGSIEAPVPFTLETTGVGDVENELSFNVQPNPFRDETVCRMELPDAQQVHLLITDMQGKNVFNTSIQANAGMNLYTWKGCSINGAPLSKGIYFIRMETDRGVLTKKVVLQR